MEINANLRDNFLSYDIYNEHFVVVWQIAELMMSDSHDEKVISAVFVAYVLELTLNTQRREKRDIAQRRHDRHIFIGVDYSAWLYDFSVYYFRVALK